MASDKVIRVKIDGKANLSRLLEQFKRGNTLTISPTAVIELSALNEKLSKIAREVVMEVVQLAVDVARASLEDGNELIIKELLSKGLSEEEAKTIVHLYNLAVERAVMLRVLHEFVTILETSITMADESSSLTLLLSLLGLDNESIRELLDKKDELIDRDVF